MHTMKMVVGLALAAAMSISGVAWAADDPAVGLASETSDQPDAPPPGAEAAPAPESAIGGYFAHWFDRVREAQDSQPHWITPRGHRHPAA